MSGVLLAGEGVASSSQGARVEVNDGKVRVIDGPFAEAKELIAGDIAAELTALKADTRLGTTGSATLVRWLVEQGLVDELHLLVHPIVVGHGQKLFEEGATVPLKLVSSTTFDTGVIHLVYTGADAEASDQ